MAHPSGLLPKCLTSPSALTLAVSLLLHHLRLLIFSQQSFSSLQRFFAGTCAAFLHLMIKPYAPSPCANEIVCASVEEMRDAVTRVIKQRPVVLSRDRVGKHEFGFASLSDGVFGHQMLLVI